MTTCSRLGCRREAIVYPMILIWSVATPHHLRKADTAISSVLKLPLCAKHQKQSTVEMFLTDQGWEKIQGFLKSAGKAAADRASATLSYTHILTSIDPTKRKADDPNLGNGGTGHGE